MTWVIAAVWWTMGTASMLWLRRGQSITWGDLLICMCLGVAGPVLWLIIGFAILTQAEFWSKPIFGKWDKS